VSKHLLGSNIPLPNRFHAKPDNFHQTGNETVDSYILVKQFGKARYSIDEIGHFGLGLSNYIHFTSPMRRYADVLVHRIQAGWKYDEQFLQEEIDYINHRNSVVRSIQTLFVKLKTTQYIQTHTNVHDIFVTGVNKTGILWFMPSYCLNGYIHVSSITPKQYWKYEKDEKKLVGQSSHNTISVFDHLQARIQHVDKVTRAITLELL
jgi:ribonuclease R